MRGATSGPTSRTLDVLELLARSPSTGIRYVDIVRQLGLNQGTAHTILKTLVDRGWVIRDPGDKTFTLGPAIAAIGAQFDQTRPLLHAARIAAKRLSEELGFSASVVELVNEELVVSAVYPGEYGEAVPQPGTKVPYVPPYGAIFAGFAPEPERVDWTTPAVAKITAMADSLADLHPSLLSAMDQVLMELTALSFDEIDTDRSVTSIIAPVLDQPGYARLGIAIHPLRPLPIQKIQACGRRLVEEGKKILDLPVPG
mgnify:CR=1 FL=1